jgi:hypothetical protein
MRKLFLAMAALTAMAVIAGCNTSEALTPPEPIGGAAAAKTQPAADSPTQTSLAAEENRNIETQQTAFPDNAASSNSGMPPPAQDGGGPRSPMLGSPGGVSATRKSIYQASTQPADASPAMGPATATSGASIRFLPIIGAPIGAVTPLSRELATAAAARGIAIKPSSDNSAQHMLKGYFCAFDDGTGTTITYVWDVLDPSGSRLTRIQGQEKIAGKSSDPWSNVPPTTMTKIANDTIAQYTAWASANRG